jgi:ATP-dependent helicase/nuclease subunit B
VIGLVELSLPVAPGQELDRGAVMAWLGQGPLQVGDGLTRELATVEASGSIPVGAWDRCSRAAGVLSGIEAWRHRLRSYAQHLIDRQPTSHSLLVTNDLALFIERLHSLSAALSTVQSWRGFRRWAEGALAELLEPSALRDALADALADLDPLDGVEALGHLPASERLRRFAAALDVVLDRPSGDGHRYGVGPIVAPLSAVAGVRSDLLLVLGCREGALPSRPPDDPLIPRFEREQIEGLAERECAESKTRRHLLSLLVACGSAQASFARIDVRAGRLVYPSRWTAELFAGRVTEVPSFAGSMRRVADGTVPAADSTDFELASLSGPVSPQRATWLERLYPDFARCRQAIMRRQDGGLSPYAGHVPAARDGEDAWSGTVSATGLQDFAECPFRFFLRRKLGVRVLEAPERLVHIGALERGALMHAVLEGFFRPSGDTAGVTVLDAAALRRLRTLANEQFERFALLGKTGKALFWDTERSQILRDLERYVGRDLTTLATEGLVPVAVELEFGREGPPLVVKAAGRDVCFTGSIDRVDHATDGRIVVVDYKSGSSDRFKAIKEDPLGRGRHLQLPIYAKAALQALGGGDVGTPPVRAEYRFLQASTGFAVVPVELTGELDDDLSEVLGTLVSTIDAGCFPLRPGNTVNGTHEHCRYCDFDPLCTTDRAHLWQRAATDPRLRPYTELVTGVRSSGEAGQ